MSYCILPLSNSLLQLYCLEISGFHFFSILRTQNLHFAPHYHSCSVEKSYKHRKMWFQRSGENTALNKVLFLICLSLQETLQALCCKVSASCLPLFLTYSFSSPFLSPFFPPPVVWVIEFIPHGRRTTSGPPPDTHTHTHHVASSAPMLHLWQLWVTMLFLNPR